jgi:hypothetical protein
MQPKGREREINKLKMRLNEKQCQLNTLLGRGQSER